MRKLNWLCFLMGIIGIPALHAQRWDAIQTGINLNYESPPDVIYADSNYLYMAGSFHIIDGQHIQGIARWNGIKWDSMGAGIDRLIMYDSLSYNPNNTGAITTYHNKLYVGGVFWSVGYLISPGIGVWTGTAWDTIPVQPFKKSYAAISQDVFALTVINNKLYVGGDFDTVAGKRCIGIACWNDTNWSSLNFPGGFSFEQINSICEYKGSIYVAGHFSGYNGGVGEIMRYDSLGWHSVDTGIKGISDWINSMVVYNGELYVGGYFYKSDGNVGNCIQKWNGTSWSDVGGGTDYQIFNLQVYNGKLYAMGQLETAGGVSADKIAEWDGTKWCSFGGNIYNTISTSCIYKDSLYIGGGFEAFANDTVSYLAEWVGGNYTDSCEDVTGINEVKGENGRVNVYPNPSNGQFTLSLSNVNTACNVEVYNVLGENIYKAKINSNNTEINISGQANGVYLYRVISETGALVGEGKVVVLQH